MTFNRTIHSECDANSIEISMTLTLTLNLTLTVIEPVIHIVLHDFLGLISHYVSIFRAHNQTM